MSAGGTAAGRTADPGAALITYYDDATGERTELSAAALGGLVARTANLLTEGCGLGPGSRAALLLPPHWQTAAVLMGCWTAGLPVAFHSAALAGLPRLGADAVEPYDATFVSLVRLNDILEDVPAATHRFVLGLAAAGRPLEQPPADYRDYAAETGAYGDDLRRYDPPRAYASASPDGTTFGQWGQIAQELAAIRGLRPGDRVLVDAAENEHPVKWLLAPLSVGASVVLCANLDPAAVPSRTAAERVTRLI